MGGAVCVLRTRGACARRAFNYPAQLALDIDRIKVCLTTRSALKARQKARAIVLSTDRAVSGAQHILTAGQRLDAAVEQVSRARDDGDPTALRAAEILKEQRLLDYRLATLPERLAPVLESLIVASTAVSQRAR